MNSNKIQRGFDYAKEASLNSTFHQHHLGAALMYHGHMLSIGWNSYKTSPVQMKYNRHREEYDNSWKDSLHAEIHCLSKARYLDIDFSKASLFIYRQYKNGAYATARPCRACMQMIKDLGIKNIYYTTDSGYSKEIII